MKNFVTHNEKLIDTNMTSLMGHINCSYQKLVSIFGEPTIGDDYKIDVEWEIEFADGDIGTIYNWKNGKNYIGEEGLEVDEMSYWNIGGFNRSVVDKIKNILK